jgi:DHA2 family lincomycin resistance protein-like MFS transporter
VTHISLPPDHEDEAENSERRLPSRDRLALGILLVSAFIVVLNETIMSVALPALMSDLDVSANEAQWVTSAFMLTMAVVIPITGFLLQRFTTKQVFGAAMLLFSVGTVVCGLAPDLATIVLGRVVQASGSAMMMPLLFTTAITLSPPASRGRTIGNISIVISVAPALGPIIAGLILSTFDWRWMFWFVLPLALGALWLGVVRVPDVGTRRAAPFDALSVVLSAWGFGGVVYGLTVIGAVDAAPWSLPAWAPLALGLGGLALFVLRQVVLQRTDRALLDLRLFLVRNFTLSVAMFAVSMMIMFGALAVLPLYLQGVLGVTTLTTGLVLLPGGILTGLLAPLVGRLYDSRGSTLLLLPGAVVVCASLWWFAALPPTTSPATIAVVYAVLSVGLAFVLTPLFTTILGSAKPSLYSYGSAVVGTTQQVAAGVGTVVFVSVMAMREGVLAKTGVSQLVAQASGVQAAFVVGAIVSIAAVLLSVFVRKPSSAPAG